MNLRVVNNDIRGLIDSVNDGSTSAFMWEWFTTKPFVDSGEVRFVRPWIERRIHALTTARPCAKSTDRIRAYPLALLDDRGAPDPRI